MSFFTCTRGAADDTSRLPDTAIPIPLKPGVAPLPIVTASTEDKALAEFTEIIRLPIAPAALLSTTLENIAAVEPLVIKLVPKKEEDSITNSILPVSSPTSITPSSLVLKIRLAGAEEVIDLTSKEAKGSSVPNPTLRSCLEVVM